MHSSGRQFAIIAGSGFRDFGSDSEGRTIETAFGAPSGPVRVLQYDDQPVYLLPRHGDDLLIPPHRINYRANLAALKSLGVEAIIAMNTVGVIHASLHPGQIAIPSQLIDYTSGRAHSIYDGKRRSITSISQRRLPNHCARICLARRTMPASTSSMVACTPWSRAHDSRRRPRSTGSSATARILLG